MIIPRQQPLKRHTLPNGTREAMLDVRAGKGLLVLECLYMLKLQPDRWYTMEQIYRVCRSNFGSSYRTIYEGLQHSLIFQKRKKVRRARERGAPPYLFRIPHPDEIIIEFGAEHRHTPSDKLEKADLKSLTTYCRALHREFLRRTWIENGGNGVQFSRKFLSDRINRSARTLRTYEKQLGFSAEPNYIHKQITMKNWYTLPRYKNKYDAYGKRLPSESWLEAHHYDSGRVHTLPLVRYLAYKHLSEGHDVFLVKQATNTYYPYRLPDTSHLESWDALGHYYAHRDAKYAAGLRETADGRWYHQLE